MEEERKRRFEGSRARFIEEVTPIELLPHLTGCLTRNLEEKILKWQDRDGEQSAAHKLSLALVKKDNWYPSILYALRNTKHCSLADEIERPATGVARRLSHPATPNSLNSPYYDMEEERKRRFDRSRARFTEEATPSELLPHLTGCLTSHLEEKVLSWQDGMVNSPPHINFHSPW